MDEVLDLWHFMQLRLFVALWDEINTSDFFGLKSRFSYLKMWARDSISKLFLGWLTSQNHWSHKSTCKIEASRPEEKIRYDGWAEQGVSWTGDDEPGRDCAGPLEWESSDWSRWCYRCWGKYWLGQHAWNSDGWVTTWLAEANGRGWRWCWGCQEHVCAVSLLPCFLFAFSGIFNRLYVAWKYLKSKCLRIHSNLTLTLKQVSCFHWSFWNRARVYDHQVKFVSASMLLLMQKEEI